MNCTSATKANDDWTFERTRARGAGATPAGFADSEPFGAASSFLSAKGKAAD